MTHDEAEDIMNDLAKDKRVIDVDEEYERRSACPGPRSTRTSKRTGTKRGRNEKENHVPSGDKL